MVIAAAVPPAIVVFLATVFNDGLMELFAGEAIQEAFEEIDDRTGDDEFYWDAEAETQDSIDEMDQKAYKHLVTVLSGIVISVSLPIVVYVLFDLFEGVIAVCGSLFVGYTFCYRSYRDLQQVVKSSIKLYN
ncbi:hypothetical protein [Haloarcula marismortui]|uniref:Uncharacterized protein n=1 Tax=Haloarcula marismortui ATCC 33800 TaxID=662476 RepID=A0A8T8KAD7_9EURY|nr:hypothetical protein [Haloarcula sinaiiensis]QUJ71930.1 hypothetical protein KDQ40_14750 [Haloarcula sinaiiensis ATCC 33800]